jgi:hypothetical protein
MAVDDTGSIIALNLNGIDYRVMGDADLSLTPSSSENSKVPTSGKPMDKIVKRIQSVESVDLAVNGTELDEIRSMAETREDIKMSFATAAGDQYHAEGRVNMESYTTQDGKLTLSLHPNGRWTPILA